MKLEMELKPGDIVLLKFLACVLIIFFSARFLILPGMETHQDLVQEKDDREVEKQEMEYSISNIQTVADRIVNQKKGLEDAKTGYYEPMENRKIDQLVTGLVLEYGLMPVYLNISDPAAGVPDAYFLAKNTGAAASGDANGGNSSSSALENADAELNAENGSTDSTNTDSASNSSYLQYVSSVSVELTLQGEETQVRALLDDIAKNYPGIQVKSFQMQDSTYVNGALEDVSHTSCSCVLAVYLCGNDSIDGTGEEN